MGRTARATTIAETTDRPSPSAYLLEIRKANRILIAATKRRDGLLTKLRAAQDDLRTARKALRDLLTDATEATDRASTAVRCPQCGELIGSTPTCVECQAALALVKGEAR